VYLAAQHRTSASAEYRTRVRILPDGRLLVGFSRVRENRETVLLTQSIPGRVSPGSVFHLEGSATGTTEVRLRARAWVEGTTRPDWQKTYVDRSAARIKTSGGTGLWAYLSSSASRDMQVGYSGLRADEYTWMKDPVTTAPPPPTPPTPTAPVKPNATNTGVPAGTTLKDVYGDIVVTEAGTVLDRLDVHGFVIVRAPNVTITRSIIRGGKATGNTGLLTNYGSDNLVIEDSEFRAAHPSVWIDGIKGWDFTARRVHVVGNVDSIKIHGPNVTIEDSLLEDTTYYASDPNQGGGATHNDNIQILSGSNIAITGNTIRGSQNIGSFCR